MSKQRDLLHELGYQLTAGQHTRGDCSTEDCNDTARGSLYCRQCATTRLAEATSPEFAVNAHMLMCSRMIAQDAIDELYAEVEEA